MNEPNLTNLSKTDWTRIDAMTDEDIDTSDIPPLDKVFFAKAKLTMPNHQVSVQVSLDADIIEWFKAQGSDWENQINTAFRVYTEGQTEIA